LSHASVVGSIVVGYLFWGFLEYTIHGLLSHRWTTFASPLHWNHHQNPRFVFTSPLAIVPTTLLLFAIGALAVGPLIAGAFVAGALAGFGRYEWMHWRFHFREPRNARERLLRSHHLAHHFCNSRVYHGVSMRFWDRVFGTLPTGWREDYARVARRAPLQGASNFAEVWNPKTTFAHYRRTTRSGR
jgi:sterol desaturase/sphingolipid hydroxylase (fatty acid hydroxylase superfamily)